MEPAGLEAMNSNLKFYNCMFKTLNIKSTLNITIVHVCQCLV